MPKVTIKLKNQPSNAAFWFGTFLKRNPDNSLTELAENQRSATNPLVDWVPITENLVFTTFLETTGFWRLHLMDSTPAFLSPPSVSFPSNENPIVVYDSTFVFDWAAKTLNQEGIPIAWLLVGGGIAAAGLLLLANRGRR